jgi:hypothetical protein
MVQTLDQNNRATSLSFSWVNVAIVDKIQLKYGPTLLLINA